MVGDGLATDLAAANGLGIPCVLMLTGVTTRAQAEALPADRAAGGDGRGRGRAGAAAGPPGGGARSLGRIRGSRPDRTGCELAAQWRHDTRRRDRRDRPARGMPEPCPPSSSPAPPASSGATSSPSSSGAGHRVVALVRSPKAGETVLRPAPRRPRGRRRAAHGRRPGAGDPAGRARRRRRRRPPRRDPARLERREGPPPGQPRRHAEPARRDAARPASGASSTSAPSASRTARSSTTRRARPAPRRPSATAGSTGRSSSRRSSSGRATASSTSSPTWCGSRPPSSRCRATGGAGSSRSTSATSPSARAWPLERPATIGQAFELGGPRTWTYREITEEVARAVRKRRLIVPMPVPAHPPGGRHHGGAPPALLPGRDRPAAPARPRQRGPARRRPPRVRLRSAQNGGRAPVPARSRGRSRSRRPPPEAGREVACSAARPVAVAWLVGRGSSSPSGRPGIVAALDHLPGGPGARS